MNLFTVVGFTLMICSIESKEYFILTYKNFVRRFEPQKHGKEVNLLLNFIVLLLYNFIITDSLWLHLITIDLRKKPLVFGAVN